MKQLRCQWSLKWLLGNYTNCYFSFDKIIVFLSDVQKKDSSGLLFSSFFTFILIVDLYVCVCVCPTLARTVLHSDQIVAEKRYQPLKVTQLHSLLVCFQRQKLRCLIESDQKLAIPGIIKVGTQRITVFLYLLLFSLFTLFFF